MPDHSLTGDDAGFVRCGGILGTVWALGSCGDCHGGWILWWCEHVQASEGVLCFGFEFLLVGAVWAAWA